ncbi:MAG: GntR family transcriptional regulator [Kiritimatiellae bacterium]|nr:GntR family transcriptional regulator [Kiritimatiellia bacterium]
MNSTRVFRYEAIAAALLRDIQRGRLANGGRLPSEPALARTFKVSHLTVRRALSRLAGDGYVSRQRGRGTFVTSHPSSRTILYVGEFEGHFYRELFLALRARAQAAQYRAFGVEAQDADPRELQRSVREHLNEAAVVVVRDIHYPALAALLADNSCRVIVVGDLRLGPDLPAHHVLTDRMRALVLAVDHLADLGHKRIVLACGGASHPSSTPAPRPRLELVHSLLAGYRGAMDANGLENSCAVLPFEVEPGVPSSGVAAVKHALSARRPPTAFVCDIDFRARAIYAAAAELKLKIPRDVSVVGLYDTPWCSAWMPELTSVSMREVAIADTVVRLCEGAPCKEPMVFRIEPLLVRRHSTCPAG